MSSTLRRRSPLFSLGALAAVPLYGCGAGSTSSATPTPPNVLLYIVDTLRGDALGCYGHPVVETPNVDALAEEGALFENAFVQSSWTRASIASILSSTYPGVHGAEGQEDPLPESTVLLSEILGAQGYRTGLITTNPNIGSFFGFRQGFDDFIELYKRRDVGRVAPAELTTTADVVVERALEWIGSAEGPFCLVLLTIDPHSPLAPPEEFDRYGGDDRVPLSRLERPFDGGNRRGPKDRTSEPFRERVRSLYYGEIAFNDHAFGTLVEGLRAADVWDETICVYTSDHGEEFWEHGQRGHGRTLYDEALRVPLVLRYPPGIEAGLRMDHHVETLDIVPTVLELADIQSTHALAGRSLFHSVEREILSTLRHNGRNYAALRSGPWKLLVDLDSGSKQLFDMNAPVPEQADAAEAHPEIVERLAARVAERLARNAARRAELQASGAPASIAPEDLPAEEAEALRSLGYLDE